MPDVHIDQWQAKEIRSIHMLQSFVGSFHPYEHPKFHAPLFHCTVNKQPIPWNVSQQ